MALYVASWGTAAGKTSLCAAVGRWLQRNGKKVGYLKPVTIADEGVDRDAGFLKLALGLPEPGEVISPLRLKDEASLRQELAGAALGAKVKQWHGDIVRGKDVVIVEGFGDLAQGGYVADASYQVVEALSARVILVAAYATDLVWEAMAPAAERFGQGVLGVVVSRVPVKSTCRTWQRTCLQFTSRCFGLTCCSISCLRAVWEAYPGKPLCSGC